MSTQDNNKPLTEQAKEAMAAAGQKASETWEATKQKVSEVRRESVAMSLGKFAPFISYSAKCNIFTSKSDFGVPFFVCCTL